jgi:hypothetical protein
MNFFTTFVLLSNLGSGALFCLSGIFTAVIRKHANEEITGIRSCLECTYIPASKEKILLREVTVHSHAIIMKLVMYYVRMDYLTI